MCSKPRGILMKKEDGRQMALSLYNNGAALILPSPTFDVHYRTTLRRYVYHQQIWWVHKMYCKHSEIISVVVVMQKRSDLSGLIKWNDSCLLGQEWQHVIQSRVF